MTSPSNVYFWRDSFCLVLKGAGLNNDALQDAGALSLMSNSKALQRVLKVLPIADNGYSKVIDAQRITGSPSDPNFDVIRKARRDIGNFPLSAFGRFLRDAQANELCAGSLARQHHLISGKSRSQIHCPHAGVLRDKRGRQHAQLMVFATNGCEESGRILSCSSLGA